MGKKDSLDIEIGTGEDRSIDWDLTNP